MASSHRNGKDCFEPSSAEGDVVVPETDPRHAHVRDSVVVPNQTGQRNGVVASRAHAGHVHSVEDGEKPEGAGEANEVTPPRAPWDHTDRHRPHLAATHSASATDPGGDRHGGHGHGGHGHGGHGHGGHGHGNGGSEGNASFGVAVSLNSIFVLIEVCVGLAVGSTALVADAAHNLGDVLGLLLAWGAARLAKRRPSSTRSYGLRKSTVLASLGNSVVLLLFLGAVIWEALHHLAEPRPVPGLVVSLVAAIGVLINLGSALLFVRAARSDLNAKGAYLHLIADAMVSVAVLVAGGVLMLEPNWTWIDPLMSIGVSLLVLRGTWRLLREALHLALDGVPEHLDLDSVRGALLELPGVTAVADLHVWAMSTSEFALTAHVAAGAGAPTQLAQLAGDLVKRRFGIGHSTIQVEDTSSPCVHC
jgi:cobalt-zinc-cadmium efflux system protein